MRRVSVWAEAGRLANSPRLRPRPSRVRRDRKKRDMATGSGQVCPAAGAGTRELQEETARSPVVRCEKAIRYKKQPANTFQELAYGFSVRLFLFFISI